MSIVSVRFTDEELVLLDKKAASCGLSRSDVIRKTALCDDKILILSDGEKIARSLFKIKVNLEKSKEINLISIQEDVKNICLLLRAVMEKISDQDA